jgi:hypothetical protein
VYSSLASFRSLVWKINRRNTVFDEMHIRKKRGQCMATYYACEVTRVPFKLQFQNEMRY